MSAAFLVFACGKCGEKVFADRSQLGKPGKCPLCGAATVIGGANAPSSERRRARRVPIANARVSCQTKTGEGRPVTPDDMPVLEDISESGVAFSIKGEPDRKKLVGWGPPPWLKVGEAVTVTLHIPQLFRPREVKAVIRRLNPVPHRKELFRVGAEFTQAGEDILRDLRELLAGR
ncbi:MAG TPA: PilZ domain-containing protein [Planctomycetota bacterium]|nr:PilZ domain-containing protein [Planctomycetota bacterium]